MALMAFKQLGFPEMLAELGLSLPPEHLATWFCGSYYLRSDHRDLDDGELWSLSITLTQVEEAFRSLKSELGLRPVHRRLTTYLRMTVSLTNDQGERLLPRQTTDPEPWHLAIYRALGLPPNPSTPKD